MFEHLDDPMPVVPSQHHRLGVAKRVRRHRIRRRGMLASASVLPVLLIVAVVTASAGGSQAQRVDMGGTPSTTATTATPAEGEPGTTTTTAARPTGAGGGGGVAPAKGGTKTTTPGAASPGGSGAPAPTTTVPAAVPSRHRYCTQSGGGEWRPASSQEFRDKVVGTWLACAAPTPWGTDEAGIDIAPDYTWAKIRRNADGTYVHMRGGDDSGWWSSTDRGSVADPNHWEISFFPDDGNLCVVTQPTFTSSVPRMRLSYEQRQADYVKPSAGEVRWAG